MESEYETKKRIFKNAVTGSLTNPIVVAQMLALNRGIYPSYTITPNLYDRSS